jgi:DNA-binding SARP family transcriptional activator
VSEDDASPESSRFRFGLIGRFSVQKDGQPLTDTVLGSRKERTLLKLLLVNRGHVVSTERIVEVLWEERPPEKAQANVSSLVSRLRGTFGANAIQGRRPGYTFATGAWAETDLEEAERLTAEAEARLSAGEPSLASVAAGRALDVLGAGRVLEEETYPPWAEEAQSRVDRLASIARRSAWTAAIQLSDPPGAIRAAEAAIAAAPLDEEPYRALMMARVQAGDRGAALEVFERLRKALRDELGVDPSPETQALHLSILRDEPLAFGTMTAASRADRWSADPGFVGRDHELAWLSDRWAGAAAGRPSLAILAGEAGIGKTRLAWEAVRMAVSTGGEVLEARCYEQERSLFLQPVLEALRSALLTKPPGVVREIVGESAGPLSGVLPEISQILRPIGYQPGPPEIERRRSFEAVSATLQHLARRHPVLLSLDDLHNAGDSSLELLHFLMRRLSGDRLLILGTVRIEEGAEPLSQLAGVADRLDVGPLPDAAVARLAELMGVADIGDRILKLARGHPLFVVEALRAMTERGGEDESAPLPDSLRGAVLSRVHRTGSAVEELLRAAATLGPAFDLSTTAGLLGVTVEEAARRAERALHAHLVMESGSGYEFANELIQEVLYQTTPLPTRIQRHRRAAALLQDNPEAVGAHAAAAEDWALALEAWLQAGERASLRFSNRDAERMLDKALHAAKMSDDRAGEARVRVARGRAREGSDEFQRAFEDHTAAAALARETGQRDVEMRALRELGGDVGIGVGLPTRDCVPYLQAGLVIAEELGDRSAQVDFLSRLAVIWVNLLRFDLAYQHVELALDIARELGDDRTLAVALDGLKAAAAYSGDLAVLERVAAQLEAMFRRRGDLWYLQWTVFESSFPPMARGQWGRATERLQEALALNRRTGHRSWRPMFVAHLGWLERSRGEYGKAIELGREAMGLAEEIGHTWWAAFAGTMLGWTLTDLFAFDAAVEQLERAVAAAERDGSENYLVRALAHLALALWLSGLRERAVETLDRAEAIFETVTAPPGAAFLHGAHSYLAAARVRLALGDQPRAEQLATTVLGPAMETGWVEVAADALVVVGRCLEGLEDVRGAEQRFAAALQMADRVGLPRVGWEAHVALAELARRENRKDAARKHGREARAITQRLAASIDDEELRQTFLEGLSDRKARR